MREWRGHLIAAGLTALLATAGAALHIYTHDAVQEERLAEHDRRLNKLEKGWRYYHGEKP